MSRPAFVCEGTDAGIGDQIVIDGAEGRHAATVQRIGVGEEIDLVDGSGRRWHCEVTGATKTTLSCRVLSVAEEMMPGPRIVLVQALAKSGRDELAIETAVEVDIDEVWAWQASRSVVVWRAERAEKSRAKWADAVRAAAKQSRRSTIPEVVGPLNTRALTERIRSAVSDGGAALVLHESADRSWADAVLPEVGSDADVLVIVGPEGGISDEELADFTAAGAQPALLGPHVLRTSTAGPIATALLNQRLRRW